MSIEVGHLSPYKQDAVEKNEASQDHLIANSLLKTTECKSTVEKVDNMEHEKTPCHDSDTGTIFLVVIKNDI